MCARVIGCLDECDGYPFRMDHVCLYGRPIESLEDSHIGAESFVSRKIASCKLITVIRQSHLPRLKFEYSKKSSGEAAGAVDLCVKAVGCILQRANIELVYQRMW